MIRKGEGMQWIDIFGEDEDLAGWCHDELDNCDCFVLILAVIGMPKNPNKTSPIAI